MLYILCRVYCKLCYQLLSVGNFLVFNSVLFWVAVWFSGSCLTIIVGEISADLEPLPELSSLDCSAWKPRL